jgi:hypothetical protein
MAQTESELWVIYWKPHHIGWWLTQTEPESWVIYWKSHLLGWWLTKTESQSWVIYWKLHLLGWILKNPPFVVFFALGLTKTSAKKTDNGRKRHLRGQSLIILKSFMIPSQLCMSVCNCITAHIQHFWQCMLIFFLASERFPFQTKEMCVYCTDIWIDFLLQFSIIFL